VTFHFSIFTFYKPHKLHQDRDFQSIVQYYVGIGMDVAKQNGINKQKNHDTLEWNFHCTLIILLHLSLSNSIKIQIS